jgi:hypothetical protein
MSRVLLAEGGFPEGSAAALAAEAFATENETDYENH